MTTALEDRMADALRGILKHDVANLRTKNEFFRCYTYNFGTMPIAIRDVKTALRHYARKKAKA